MFMNMVFQAFDDMFDHLGDEYVFQSRNGTKKTIVAVIKQPENPYVLGDSSIIEQVAEITMKSSDISPKIGDCIITKTGTYKIYEEPMLDASNYLWRFHAVLMEKEGD